MSRYRNFYVMMIMVALCACNMGEQPDDLLAFAEEAATLAGDTELAEFDSLDQPLGSIAAQAAGSNRATAEALHLLARVEVQPDELFEIYEPRPGWLVFSSAGAPASSPLALDDLQGKTLAQIWELVAPGEPMPASLAAAAERLDEARQLDEARHFDEARQPDAQAAQAGGGHAEPNTAQTPTLAAGYCDITFLSSSLGNCILEGWDTDFTDCINNWWNGRYAWVSNGYFTEMVVCPATGDVVLKVQTDEGYQGTWTVANNTHRRVTVYDSGCGHIFDDCPTVRADVLQASGDRFHFRFLSDLE